LGGWNSHGFGLTADNAQPVGGLRLSFGLSYFAQSPQMFRLSAIGESWWSGSVCYFSFPPRIKQIRETTAIFSTVEKTYLVFAIIYCFRIDAPYAKNYLTASIADTSMAIGGIWYLWRSRNLKQD
jgi:hypothetical protein